MENDRIVKNNIKVYNKLAKEYESRSEKNRKLTNSVLPRILKYIKSKNNFLDVGCGIGLHMQIFEKIGFKTTGIDISKKMINYAKKRNPKSKIILGDFLKIDFKDKFDFILLLAFIHLYPQKQVDKILQKVSSLLTKEGIALISTTKHNKGVEGFFKKEDYSGTPKRFRKKWTKEELTKKLSKYFNILDYFEKKDSFNKNWMIYIVNKK